ncbi:MAG TPA: PTS sugar transporter subunit IIA [Candidatus Binatia bacterium]
MIAGTRVLSLRWPQRWMPRAHSTAVLRAAIGAVAAPDAPAGTERQRRTMQFSRLIAPVDVLVGLKVADKPQLIREVARRLADRSGLPVAVVDSLLNAREELGSTGVGRGVALPHARVPGAKQPCAIFARLAKPVDFLAVDGRPVDLVCAIIAPDQPRTEALSALAAVSRVLRDPVVVDAIRKATTQESIYDQLMVADAAVPTS